MTFDNSYPRNVPETASWNLECRLNEAKAEQRPTLAFKEHTERDQSSIAALVKFVLHLVMGPTVELFISDVTNKSQGLYLQIWIRDELARRTAHPLAPFRSLLVTLNKEKKISHMLLSCLWTPSIRVRSHTLLGHILWCTTWKLLKTILTRVENDSGDASCRLWVFSSPPSREAVLQSDTTLRGGASSSDVAC